MTDFIKRLVAIACCIVLVACSNGSALNGSDANGTFVETGGSQAAGGQGVGGQAAANAQKIFAANAGQPQGAAADDYKISPLDVIDINVFGVQELNRTVQVSSSGIVTMPLINQIKAGGRTTGQLEGDIAKKLSVNYLQSPQVSVFVKP
jgi:polysaccharide biosynthesis/export protein